MGDIVWSCKNILYYLKYIKVFSVIKVDKSYKIQVSDTYSSV